MEYAQAVARVLANRIMESKTTTAKATVVAVTADGFVTFTDAMGATRKGVWVTQQPAVGDVITYLDEGNGFPMVLGTSGAWAWTQVTFQNSWVNYGSGWETAAYRKVGDMVYLRGLVMSGTVPGAIFTLPSGYRPPASVLFGVETSSGHGRVDVSVAGPVDAVNGANGYVTLSGISFSTV